MPDVDGFTSSAVFYNYLMSKPIRQLYSNFTIDYHIPDGKTHGLEAVMKELEQEKIYDLILVPDAGSNDHEYMERLTELGYEILIADHHIADSYDKNGIVINNQLSNNYENKELTGVGVVYKFLTYCDWQFETNLANSFLDLVALGQISDMASMNTLENRYILRKGLTHINNEFFKELLEKQSYSLGDGPLTQIGVAFYITPLINALIRVGSHLEKENLFKAFITPNLIVPSTKRGESGMTETIACQSARNCVNAKARQNREKDKAMELLDIQIMNDCLDENKILILNADELDVSNTLTGLCAMGIAAKYKKPTILGRTSPDGMLKGSMRGLNESELKDFRQFLLNSGLVAYTEG